MTQQTAVEWLINELESKATTDYSFAQAHKLITLDGYTFNKLIEQAKQIEKEQIEEAFYQGVVRESDHHGAGYLGKEDAEQHYNETYKK